MDVFCRFSLHVSMLGENKHDGRSFVATRFRLISESVRGPVPTFLGQAVFPLGPLFSQPPLCCGCEAWTPSSMPLVRIQSRSPTKVASTGGVSARATTVVPPQDRCSAAPSRAPARSPRSKRTSGFSASQSPKWSNEKYCTEVHLNDSIGLGPVPALPVSSRLYRASAVEVPHFHWLSILIAFPG